MNPHRLPRTFRAAIYLSGMTLSVVLLSTSITIFAQEPDRENHPAPTNESLFERTIYSGVVFFNGKYVKPPYRIVGSQNSLTINDLPHAVFEPPAPTGRFGGFRGGSRWSGPQFDRRGVRLRGKPEDNADTKIASGRDDQPETRHEPHQPKYSGPARSMTRFAARQIAHDLERDALVILFDKLPIRSVDTPSDQWDIYELLLTEKPTLAQEDQFAALAQSNRGSETWRNWLREFTPDTDSRAIMLSAREAQDRLTAEIERQHSAVRRLDQLAYPLTILGMILSVVAFGNLLQWVGKGLVKDNENSPHSARHVVFALWLMLGMSMIDLSWTILAGQAGVMREVNPLAANFLDNPAQLALFKVVATLTAFAILFVWRKRYQMQQATWWICLLCVLVTFRWVIFDSMLN